MRAREIIIHNFKSVAKDCFLKVDKFVTTLVGASQSGKTNVLWAIEKFTIGDYQPDDICDFSRAGRVPPPDADMSMITITFDIEESDKEALREISSNLDSIEELKVTRKYNGEYSIDIPGINFVDNELSRIVEQTSKINQQLESFLGKCREEWEDIEEELNEASDKLAAFKTAITYPVQIEAGAQMSRFSEALEPVREAFNSLFDVLVEQPEQVPEQIPETERESLEGQEEVSKARQSISELESLAKQGDDIIASSRDTVPKITALLPAFIYVGAEHENLLCGEVSLDELESAPEDDVRFVSVRRLIKLADLNLATLPSLSSIQRRRLLKNASNRVTEALRKTWRQQHVAISLDLAGPNERQLRIWVSSDSGPDRFPEHQGYGFRWYLEFYLSYAIAAGEELKHSVLLLDEAGIHLHPFAQRNLVDELKEIATNNQIIHTTHLVDMLDLENPERWRVVENDAKSGIGTQIINEAYQPREDHIGFEIIMKSLWGSAIVPSFALGPRNLIVEGAADIILLSAVSRILGRDKEEDAILVSGEVAMLPTGGLSYYRRMLVFCNRPGFNTVALFDSDTDGKLTKQALTKDGILSSSKAIEINDVYSSSTEERELENIFGFSLLKEAAMQFYQASLPTGFDFKSSSLPAKGGLGKRFKEFFENQGIERYDKTKVAETLKRILSSEPGKLTKENREKFSALIGKIRDAFQDQALPKTKSGTS